MDNKNLPIKKPDEGIIFPEEFTLIIKDLLKKYDLDEIQKINMKKFVQGGTTEERKKIFTSSPGFIISQLVRDYAEGRISLEKIPDILKEGLHLPDNAIKKLAKDLNENILLLIKPLKKRGILKKEGVVEEASEIEPLKPASQKPRSEGKDIYRESIG